MHKGIDESSMKDMEAAMNTSVCLLQLCAVLKEANVSKTDEDLIKHSLHLPNIWEGWPALKKSVTSIWTRSP